MSANCLIPSGALWRRWKGRKKLQWDTPRITFCFIAICFCAIAATTNNAEEPPPFSNREGDVALWNLDRAVPAAGSSNNFEATAIAQLSGKRIEHQDADPDSGIEQSRESPTAPILRFSVDSFAVVGENPLSDNEVRNVLTPYLGMHEGVERLRNAASALETHLVENGFSFYRVILPPQTLRESVVTLEVIAFKISTVDVEGNVHFSDNNIRRSLPSLRVGASPDTRAIARERLHANEHPSKQVEVIFREGEETRSLNGTVRVRDSRPYNVFFVINNTGSDDTGEFRATLGAQHSNLFNLDHALRLSYTTSPEDFDAVKQFGAFYRLPIYKFGGYVDAYYVDSTVDTGVVAEAFDVSGSGEFAGIGYSHTLPPSGAYRHSVSANVDDRLFDNEILFLGLPIGTDVRSRPAHAAYRGAYETPGFAGSFYVSYAHNIPGSGSNNDDIDYLLARAGADADWDVVRSGLTGDFSFKKDWRLSTRVDGQYSDEPLIPGEQFGVGGMFSVRGYEERELAGDSGIFTALEVWTPVLPYDFQLLGFLDYGYVRNDNALPGEFGSDSITGVGFGVRWFWKTNISLQLDAAQALSDGFTTHSGDNKLHFNLLVRY